MTDHPSTSKRFLALPYEALSLVTGAEEIAALVHLYREAHDGHRWRPFRLRQRRTAEQLGINRNALRRVIDLLEELELLRKGWVKTGERAEHMVLHIKPSTRTQALPTALPTDYPRLYPRDARKTPDNQAPSPTALPTDYPCPHPPLVLRPEKGEREREERDHDRDASRLSGGGHLRLVSDEPSVPEEPSGDELLLRWVAEVREVWEAERLFQVEVLDRPRRMTKPTPSPDSLFWTELCRRLEGGDLCVEVAKGLVCWAFRSPQWHAQLLRGEVVSSPTHSARQNQHMTPNRLFGLGTDGLGLTRKLDSYELWLSDGRPDAWARSVPVAHPPLDLSVEAAQREMDAEVAWLEQQQGGAPC